MPLVGQESGLTNWEGFVSRITLQGYSWELPSITSPDPLLVSKERGWDAP